MGCNDTPATPVSQLDMWQPDSFDPQLIDRFLVIADRHGIGAMPVFFDSCWDPQPRPEPQRSPLPRVHNSGCVQSPGRGMLGDERPLPEAGPRGRRSR